MTPATTAAALDILMSSWGMAEQLRVDLVGWLSRSGGASGDAHWRICVDVNCCVDGMGFRDLLDRCKLITAAF
jgi:hypothetical protein